MVTLTKTELRWLANACHKVMMDSKQGADDESNDQFIRALFNQSFSCYEGLYRKMLEVLNGTDKRIALKR